MRQILLLCSLLVVVSCTKAVIHPIAPSEGWDVQVEDAKVAMSSPGESGSVNFDNPNGTIALAITVPSSTRPTRIEARRKPHTIKQTIKELLTNTPAYDVKSDAPGVKVFQPHKTVWWRWVIVILASLFAVASIFQVVALKVANFSPWGFVVGLFKKRK